MPEMKSDIISQKENLTLSDLETTKSPDMIEMIMGYLLVLVEEYSDYELYDTTDSTGEIFINQYVIFY